MLNLLTDLDYMMRRAIEGWQQRIPTRVGDLEKYPFEFRMRLLVEELREFIDACGYDPNEVMSWSSVQSDNFPAQKRAPDILAMIDAICDITVVAVGSATQMNIRLVPHLLEVHARNMAKIKGGYKDVHGKWQKPIGWTPPDHLPILRLQQFDARQGATGIDSANRAVRVGSKVAWRGSVYTIKAFGAAAGKNGSRLIEFEEESWLADKPDELSIELVTY